MSMSESKIIIGVLVIAFIEAQGISRKPSVCAKSDLCQKHRNEYTFSVVVLDYYNFKLN